MTVLIDMDTVTVRPNVKTHIAGMAEYERMYKESIESPEAFFKDMALKNIDWFRPFDHVKKGGFENGDVAWFEGGQLNVSYNCVDRHAAKDPTKVAIIYEADEPDSHVYITYGQLLDQVCRFSNVLKKKGVKKGDTVCIYMPMVPEAAYAMLACARIGAVHSVVFAGFSSEALRSRILDANCKILITSDQGKRGGKTIHLKRIADEAIMDCPANVIVFQRTGDPSVIFNPEIDCWWHEEVREQRPVCPCEFMNSEDPLFMLYTSGSTGKPKGVVHTQAGYILGATLTCKYVFDLHPGDIYACMADVGWITGHSYIVYGPLSNGVTTLMFESVPTYPSPSRYWQMVDKHKINQLYTAPTAIRALRRFGDEYVSDFKLNSLRTLGSVGEPINPEAWAWYYGICGREKCVIVDTYWQTETGSIIVTPLPGVGALKPGSATFPFFGIDLAILDPTTGQELIGNNVTGVLAIRNTWPSLARTVYNNHSRYLDTYMNPYKGFYFTGDGATRDADGFYWIRGRVEYVFIFNTSDVINVSGHRLSTAEIESALIVNPNCSESAVIGIPDDLTGQAIVCFCTLKSPAEEADTVKSLINEVRSQIGPFAAPKRVYLVPDLPKTRSGKIMRRILRKLAGGDVKKDDIKNEKKLMEVLGDLSTLADPSVIYSLIEKIF